MTAVLQTSDGDIALTKGRATLVTGTEERGQKITNRLTLVKGEWFLDSRVGTPYYEKILGQKSPDIPAIERVYARVILSVPGVVDVREVEASLDTDRELSYSFVAIDDEGNEIEGGIGPAFIVEDE